ncbi:cupin domain-containing protein [Kitasatospora sp. NBC_00240]|uniref:cupin domain-containing protein n=1 Tax=Kitasatospora sp. NBC_00240 TaxID=2903567 RepID=UPI00224E6E50|nr:cupin domain-containing protein [Kitasatospora sp. NBC_00240]MCX5208115.1 cupin domain-containing protein [Kitasatospora sp. NBC_00240]
MTLVDLAAVAAALPGPWSSRVLGEVGDTQVKVLRMDGTGLPAESHPTAEALLVLDGRLELEVAGCLVPVPAGQLYVLPADTPHAVRAGSHGTLLIVERG